MGDFKKGMKEIFKKLLLGFSIIGIIIVFFGAIIVAFLKSDLVASAYSGNYSDYVNLGDYIVKTDEEGAMPALTKQQLKIAIQKAGFSEKMKAHYIDWSDAIIEIQSKYKINAAFTVAVIQNEHGGGGPGGDINWGSIPANTYNIFSISKASGGWVSYSSYEDAIKSGFGNLIAKDGPYFSEGRYSVEKIKDRYDDNPVEQWDTHIKNTIDSLYSAVAETLPSDSGSQNNGKYTYRGHTYTLFNQNNYSYPFGVGKTISSSGCGVTSIAICVSGFKKGEDPVSITKHCHEQKRIYIYI